MDASIKAIAQTIVVDMGGRLNGNAKEIFEDELLPQLQDARQVILDLGRVTFLSSYALRMLLLLHRQVTRDGGRLLLVGLSEELSDTMAITGFLDFFTIHDTLAHGLQALEPG